jgi:hypothetical protein
MHIFRPLSAQGDLQALAACFLLNSSSARCLSAYQIHEHVVSNKQSRQKKTHRFIGLREISPVDLNQV